MADIDLGRNELNMDLSELRAIIFDFDGTLVDSEPIWKKVFLEIFSSQYNIDIPNDVLWANTGVGVPKSVENIDAALSMGLSSKQRHDLIRDIFLESYRQIAEEAPLRNEAEELFEIAKAHDIVMAICSASDEDEIRTFIKNRNIEHYFSHITSTAGYAPENKKPSPYPYTYTLEVLGVEAERAIVFEDSPAGVISATSAGIKTIAIDNQSLEKAENLGFSALVPDFRSVLDLFSSLKL